MWFFVWKQRWSENPHKIQTWTYLFLLQFHFGRNTDRIKNENPTSYWFYSTAKCTKFSPLIILLQDTFVINKLFLPWYSLVWVWGLAITTEFHVLGHQKIIPWPCRVIPQSCDFCNGKPVRVGHETLIDQFDPGHEYLAITLNVICLYLK